MKEFLTLNIIFIANIYIKYLESIICFDFTFFFQPRIHFINSACVFFRLKIKNARMLIHFVFHKDVFMHLKRSYM